MQRLKGNVVLTEALGSEVMAHIAFRFRPRAPRRRASLRRTSATNARSTRSRVGGSQSRRSSAGSARARARGRARRSRSPSTRAASTSSIRKQDSVSTTEPTTRGSRHEEAPVVRIVGALTVALAGAVVAATKPRAARTSSRGASPARFRSSRKWTGEEQKSFQAVLEPFKKANPGVTVKYPGAATTRHRSSSTAVAGREPAGHRDDRRSPGSMTEFAEARRAEADHVRSGDDRVELPAGLAAARIGQREALRPLLQGREQVDRLVQRRRRSRTPASSRRRRGRRSSRPRRR